MEISRRTLLAAGAAATAAGCAPLAARVRRKAPLEAFTLPSLAVSAGYRLFHRAGFGPRPGDLQAYARDGHEATIERLLNADQEEEAHLQMLLRRQDVFRSHPADLNALHRFEVIRQLQQVALLRAVYGANPLLERMADFWTNHFSIYSQKGLTGFLKGRDETRVVRDHALGRFPKMLEASAKSPAMLAYLDDPVSTKEHPNENYAREIMELHTLGVDGGYTQKDVMEVARCFTGWGIEDRIGRPRGHFRFVAEVHDDGEKTALGHKIPAGGGVKDGEQVLEILAKHPNTARHLARKLVLSFVGEPSPALEKRVADAYLKSNGDVRSMVRPILRSEELLAGPPIVKRPLDLVAGALRGLDATTDASPALLEHLRTMGQPLYEWPMPDGFPSDSASWTGSMLPRWNFALALGKDGISGTSLRDDLSADDCYRSLLGREPGNDELTKAMRGTEPKTAAALAVASPEFQWR